MILNELFIDEFNKVVFFFKSVIELSIILGEKKIYK